MRNAAAYQQRFLDDPPAWYIPAYFATFGLVIALLIRNKE